MGGVVPVLTRRDVCFLPFQDSDGVAELHLTDAQVFHSDGRLLYQPETEEEALATGICLLLYIPTSEANYVLVGLFRVLVHVSTFRLL